LIATLNSPSSFEKSKFSDLFWPCFEHSLRHYILNSILKLFISFCNGLYPRRVLKVPQDMASILLAVINYDSISGQGQP